MARRRLHGRRNKQHNTTAQKQQITWAKWHPRRNIQSAKAMDSKTNNANPEQNQKPRQATTRMETRNHGTHI